MKNSKGFAKKLKRFSYGERDFKPGQRLLCERIEIKYQFISKPSVSFPTNMLCQVTGVSKSAYYDWVNRPTPIIPETVLFLYRRMKALCKASRQHLGSGEMVKTLREEGFDMGRYRVRQFMRKLDLNVLQRVAYKMTTKRKHGEAFADNLLNLHFNPVAPNPVWDGDVTCLKTRENWMYLVIVMDLYSRRIMGWHVDKRMTTDLVQKAMIKTYNLRQPPKGLVFHSDRGSQYTSKQFRTLLKNSGMRSSMGDIGVCWDNAVVARFFGRLKQDWLFKVTHQLVNIW